MARQFISYATIIVGLVVLAMSALLVGRFLMTKDGSIDDTPEVVTVKRATFSAQIINRGIVRPARISPISSMISSNQAKIVWLIKEGTHVSKGTLVARFDTKPFMDSLQKAEQLYGDAAASYLAAQKLLFLQQEEEEGKIEESERKLEIAQIKANNVVNGSGPLKRKVLIQKLNQAKRALAISRSELNDLALLLEKGHVSEREKDKAKDQVITAEEQVAVAEAEIDNFDKYTWPQMLREAELLGSGAQSELERVKRTAELLIQNRAAEVEKHRRKKENKLLALNRAKQDIAHCEVYSPAGGIVLYSKLPRENGRRKIHIGDSVWVGQTFMEVPDTEELIAEIQVREVDVAKIKTGMAVELEVDAFPERTYKGTVVSIASLARDDAQQHGVRQFTTRIQFRGTTGNIHVGMSVTSKINYNRVEDALVIPLSALTYSDGAPRVMKVDSDQTERIPVAVGLQNHYLAEITSGLSAGDVIIKEPL